jgi:hypothetical protein
MQVALKWENCAARNRSFPEGLVIYLAEIIIVNTRRDNLASSVFIMVNIASV